MLKLYDYVTYKDEMKSGKRADICSIGCIVAISPTNSNKCIVDWFCVNKYSELESVLLEEDLNTLCKPNLLRHRKTSKPTPTFHKKVNKKDI